MSSSSNGLLAGASGQQQQQTGQGPSQSSQNQTKSQPVAAASSPSLWHNAGLPTTQANSHYMPALANANDGGYAGRADDMFVDYEAGDTLSLNGDGRDNGILPDEPSWLPRLWNSQQAAADSVSSVTAAQVAPGRPRALFRTT